MMRSVRVTLILGYVGVLAVILGVFSLLFYRNVSSSLGRDVDKTLTLQADGVAETVFAFWRAERAATGAGPGNWVMAPANSFEGEIEQGGLPALLGRWAEKTGNLDTEHPIRLMDKSGKPLGASPSFTQLDVPLTETMIGSAREERTLYETLATSKGRIRLITRPIFRGKRALYSVQVAATLAEVDASLARLRLLLLILIPAMLASISAIGLILASRVFGPIGTIILRARRFTEESLHERLAVPRTHDELEQLEATLNEMLAKLERAFRRLRQFSAATSHELRTPLTVMKGEIGVALRKPRSADEYRRVLQAQLGAVDDMASTVEELLTLAQSEAVEGEAGWRPVELGALTRQACGTFQNIAKSRAIRVERMVTEPVWVRGERRLLERLIANLLDNAIKHTPPKGLIVLLVDRQGQAARVAVQDSGPGIPPEQMPHLFEQFFRRRPTEDGARTGGLGLGLCRWIADMHHGSLEVTSAPGQGTSFILRLPVLSRSPEALPVSA